MWPSLRTFLGRPLTQYKSYSKPVCQDPNEIQVGLTLFARYFSRKPSKGRIGFRLRGGSSSSSKAERAPSTPISSPDGPFGGPLLKPALFAAATCTCAFSAAAVFKYEDYVYQHERDLRDFNSVAAKISRFFDGPEKSAEWRQQINRIWSRFSTGEKMAMGCIWLNLCVFAGWQSRNPKVAQIMHTYFTASVFGKAPCSSMLLSTFSHSSFTHLAVNMICLWSFAPTVVNLLGKEQAAALYISAGMTSALASYCVNVMRASTVVSVGASGAILGLAGAVCTQFPDAKLAIIFLPMFPIAAKYALGGLICMDTAGVLLRWNFFDHAGHLGGTLFGVGYMYKGNQYILQFQKKVLEWWDEYR